MDQTTEKKTEAFSAFPYPVVYFDGEGCLVEASESTKALFEPWRQGKRMLEQQVERYGLRHAGILSYRGEHFFSVTVPSQRAEGLWEMHLTRELFPALRRLSLTLLSCLEHFLQSGDRGKAEEIQRSRTALREALTPYRGGGNRVSCRVEGFLKALSAALSMGGVTLSYACDRELCVLAEPALLRELICSLLQFTGTVSHRKGLGCGLRVKEDSVEIALYGDDRGEGMRCLEEVFAREGESGEEILATLPLLGGILSCLREEYGLQVTEKEERTVLTLSLPRTDALPDAFLGKDPDRERDRLHAILHRKAFF